MEPQTPEEFRMYKERPEIRDKQQGMCNPVMSPGGEQMCYSDCRGATDQRDVKLLCTRIS